MSTSSQKPKPTDTKHDAKATSYIKTKLTAEDHHTALAAIKQEQKEETEKAKKLTGNTTLTDEEYQAANPEFKQLVEKARGRGLPIYVMPELDKDQKLHPRLKTIVDGIKQGKPYHTFITVKYGELCPLLLRLLLGLKSEKFQISIEQFDSMMTQSYWLGTSIQKVENIPLFKAKTLTEVGGLLVHQALFDPTTEEKKKEIFLKNMMQQSIPEGERSVQVIYLDVHHYRSATLAINLLVEDGYGSICPQVLQQQFLLQWHDQKVFEATEGKFDPVKVHKNMAMRGMEMFVTALKETQHAYYRLFHIRQPNTLSRPGVFLLPTQTMLKIWHESLYPDRQLRVIRRAGPFDVKTMEEDSDSNGRTVSMVFPGIPDPGVAHRKPVWPAYNRLHDQTHTNYEAALSKTIFKQMTHGKNVLRRFYSDKSQCTSSILRFLDRDKSLRFPELERFYALITNSFSTDRGTLTAKLELCSILILVNMILESFQWPYYMEMRQRMTDALLPCTIKKPTAAVLETITRSYAGKVKHDHSLIAILLLCHFYLNDLALGKGILELVPHKQLIQSLFAWPKKEHGDLYPVLVHRVSDDGFVKYPFEALAAMPAAERLKLLPAVPSAKADEKADEMKTFVVPPTANHYLSHLHQTLGTINGKRVVNFNEQKATASFPLFWLRQLGAEAISELSKELNVPVESLRLS